MLSLPQKYRKDAPVAKVTFVKGAQLAGAEKKRFETAVEDIKLMYQIEGFDIPNLVNDEYNCQVIMFLRIKLKDLKQASFIAKIVQKCIAPLCIIEFTDGSNAVYSFADKRLNKQNERSFIIVEEYVTDKLPLDFQNDLKTLFSLYIDYETILNRNNKHSYYLEMMCKAFLVFNHGLFKNDYAMLDSKMWYDDNKLMLCFPLLKKLKILKLSVSKAKTLSEKSDYNKQIKDNIQKLKNLYSGEDDE